MSYGSCLINGALRLERTCLNSIRNIGIDLALFNGYGVALGFEQSCAAEPAAAPDGGRSKVFQRSTSHQQPPRVSLYDYDAVDGQDSVRVFFWIGSRTADEVRVLSTIRGL